jgi:hypothetical protein
MLAGPGLEFAGMVRVAVNDASLFGCAIPSSVRCWSADVNDSDIEDTGARERDASVEL